MDELNDEQIRKMIKQAIPPIADPELRCDLWPEMLRRLAEQPARMAWLDWALLGTVAIWVLVSPEMIPILLYHL